MFILKRQDVEISSIPHPKRDQPMPVLHYQGQTFRLISVFKASQEEAARALWRELSNGRGKACVLLEEPDRYSIWGKIRLDLLGAETDAHNKTGVCIQASILLLQAVFLEIEDFLGARQAALFEKDITEVLRQKQLPQASSPEAVKYLLNEDPLDTTSLPSWQEHHVEILLQELHKLGKAYFGNTNFAHPVVDRLQDMPEGERSLFISWLNQSPMSKLWQ